MDSKRAAYASGLVVLLILDLLALDDITTAGAWFPEVAFLVVSIPALFTLGAKVLRQSTPEGPRLQRASSPRRLR